MKGFSLSSLGFFPPFDICVSLEILGVSQPTWPFFLPCLFFHPAPLCSLIKTKKTPLSVSHNHCRRKSFCRVLGCPQEDMGYFCTLSQLPQLSDVCLFLHLHDFVKLVKEVALGLFLCLYVCLIWRVQARKVSVRQQEKRPLQKQHCFAVDLANAGLVSDTRLGARLYHYVLSDLQMQAQGHGDCDDCKDYNELTHMCTLVAGRSQ